MQEKLIAFTNVSKVEVFENHTVYVRGAGGQVIATLTCASVQDAKGFADLFMSLRSQYRRDRTSFQQPTPQVSVPSTATAPSTHEEACAQIGWGFEQIASARDAGVPLDNELAAMRNLPLYRDAPLEARQEIEKSVRRNYDLSTVRPAQIRRDFIERCLALKTQSAAQPRTP